jgi:hypothetical protein
MKIAHFVPIGSQTWPPHATVVVVAMFANDQDEMSNLHRGPSIDASYQVSLPLSPLEIN